MRAEAGNMGVSIGVLALQGAVEEHLFHLQALPGVEALPIKTQEELCRAQGIILPGGESTVMGKLLRIFGLFEPLRQRILAGMPVWGTCAGMILLAREIEGEEAHLDVMDIVVRRNAYGGQMFSFDARAVIPAVSGEPLPLTFIRAPWIARAGAGVTELLRLEGRLVAAREGNMLATSFHPELTSDIRMHAYFASMVRQAAKTRV